MAEMARSPEIELALQDRAHVGAKLFSEYLCDNAETHLYRPELSPTTVMDVIHTLDRKGYPMPHNDDREKVSLACHPAEFYELRDEWLEDNYVTSEDDTAFGSNKIEVCGMVCKPAPSLPERTAVAVHEDVAVPNRHLQDYRPWLVRDSSGVVKVVVHD